jgi:hypothetical protein
MPLHSGQQVVVIGEAPQLTAALEEEEIITSIVVPISNAKHLLAADRSADHVIVPVLLEHNYKELLQEISRIIKPGGWLLLGFRNAEGLSRLAFWKTAGKNGAPHVALNTCQELLTAAGFGILSAFGVRQNLENPQFLIPLDRRATSHFFFQRIFFPNTRAAALAQKAASVLTSAGLQRVLFTDIAVLAQKRHTAEVN